MLYHVAEYLKPLFPWLNIVHYVSFRAIAGLLTALALSIFFGDWFIETSKKFFRAKAREYTPEHHKQKDDMPTMGGIFVLMIVFVATFFWANLLDGKVWLFLFCLIAFGAIGFWDDWYKIRYQKGISARAKFIAQWSVAAIISVLLFFIPGFSTALYFPFFKHLHPDLSWLFIPWAMFILVATSNAVNLTDGLDGLAIGSLIPNFAVFSIFCYLSGNILFSLYLHIPFTASAEITLVGAVLVGASLGFLWFNAYPAQIFMGDVGSLSLGAGLAFMALVSKQELLLAVAGGLFVLETISVMMQVWYYKISHKRLFKMAPIHHHFELLGWPEAKITVRFGIISLMLCLMALITIKIR